MDRYADNGSPEPTQATSSTNTSTSSEELSLLSGCYKTPDTYQHYNGQFAQYNQMNPIGGFYPTPPSDNEDSSTLPAANIYQANHYSHIQSLTPLTSTTNLPHNYYNNSSSSSSSINDPNTSTSSSVNEEASVNRQLYKEETTTEGKLPPSKEIELLFAPIDEPLDKKGRYKRRTRTCFSKYQLDVLEATFQKYNYPEIHVVDKLCDELNLKQERISIWFQNRRARSKKCKKQEAKESKENRCDNRPKPPTEITPSIQTSSTQYPSIPVSSRAPVTTTPAYPATTAYHNYNTFYTGLPTYQQSTPTIAASNSSYYSVPANYYQNQFYQYPAFYQAPNLDVYSQTNSATANYLQSGKKEEEATN